MDEVAEPAAQETAAQGTTAGSTAANWTTAQWTAGAATVLLGAGLAAAEAAWQAARPVRAVSAGVVRGAVAVAGWALPETVGGFAVRGQRGRVELEAGVDDLLGFAIGRILDAFLATVDLTAFVCRNIDLDAIAAALDVDGVVARVDLDAIVRRLDLDAVAAGLDVDRVVARVDLDAVVRRLDLDRVVARVDLDAIVRRLDLDAVAARLDVDRVVAGVDLDAVVRRLDLVGIAQEVIDAIDLPELIRHSTGALTSDSVRTVRTEARHADDVVSGVVDRLLHRSRATGSAGVAAVPTPR